MEHLEFVVDSHVVFEYCNKKKKNPWTKMDKVLKMEKNRLRMVNIEYFNLASLESL